MKNAIIFIFLLFSISAFAQQNKWDIGIVGGAGITDLRIQYSLWPTPSPTIGFYAGLSAQYNFNEHYALHTELAFDRKGTVDKSIFTDQSGNELGKAKWTNQLNYLTMPLLFRVSLGNKTKYFLQAGPSLSYLLNQTSKFSAPDPQYNASLNYTANRSNMDFEITAGLGLVIPIKENFSISGELRGNYGLVDILNNNVKTPTKQFNQSLNFLVGINYKLGK